MQARLLASPSIPMHAHLHAYAAAQTRSGSAWPGALAASLRSKLCLIRLQTGKGKHVRGEEKKKRQRRIGLVPAPSCGSRGNHIQRPNTVMPPLCSRLQARNPRKQRSPPTRVGKPNPLIISLNFSGSHVGGARTHAYSAHRNFYHGFTVIFNP